MELTFNKDGNLYVTEFEVTADFNLHLERDKGGKVSFYQRSTNGQYDTIEELEKNIDLVFDYDFQSLVWPKYIKITSESLPTVATLTTNGEVTEIKSQSKEVEIVSNGTTVVEPDAGFAYLNKVSVKTNVPQEGGGGTVEYLDVSEVDTHIKQVLLLYSLYAKVPQDTIIDTSEDGNQGSATLKAGISPSSSSSVVMGILGMSSVHIDTFLACITALGFDFSQKMVAQGQTMTLNEMLTMYGIKETVDAIPRITEEEFYNLNA